MSWRDLAACEWVPDEERAYFFGDSEDGTPTHLQHEQARLYCYSCPVQVDCLRYCLETDQKYGVWGGLTESQRKRYLTAAMRDSLDDEELAAVILKCGTRIFKRLEELQGEAPLPDLLEIEPRSAAPNLALASA